MNPINQGGQDNPTSESAPLSASTPEARSTTASLGRDAAIFDRPLVTRNAGEALGPFRLERPLGRGGFGEVWCATHERLGRRVALKLLRPDRLEERSLRRFEAERESLRLLAHPNVAKIYDAGTTDDGAPYIAMEFIEGVPLTHYCDRLRLSLNERLALFATVCDAVHYVHLQGIIHRDLSPDNILVALSGPEEGQPKIIDFGIARAAGAGLRLSEETIGEGLGHVVGKLMYMSPEQAEAGPGGVDARTDIYALGVILYELLAGALPIDSGAFRAQPLTRAVKMLVEDGRRPPAERFAELDDGSRRAAAEARRERDAAALAQHLSGRVRFLPLTAMHLDRNRRFSSAAALAEDIRAYVDGRDFVQAAQDPRLDKVLRHMRRHRLLWTAGTLIFLSLVGGVVGTSLGLAEARRNAALAEDRLTLSNSVVTYLTDDFLGAAEGDGVPSDTTLAVLLTTAADRVDRRFAERPEIRSRLLGAIASWALQSGQRERAEGLLTQAREAAESAGADPLELARIDLLRCEAMWRSGRAEEARSLADAVFAQFDASLGSDHPDTLAARNQLANAIKHAKLPHIAEPMYREILADRRRVLGADHIDTLITEHNLALSLFMQAKAESDAARRRRLLEDALAIELPSWETTSRLFGRSNEQAIVAGAETAAMLQTLRRYDEADRIYSEVLPLLRERLGGMHFRTQEAQANFGRLLLDTKQLDRAAPVLDAALAQFKARKGVLDGDTSVIAGWLAEAYEKRGELDRAEAALVELYEGVAASPPSTARNAALATQAIRIAELLDRAGKTERAKEWRDKVPPTEPSAPVGEEKR